MKRRAVVRGREGLDTLVDIMEGDEVVWRWRVRTFPRSVFRRMKNSDFILPRDWLSEAKLKVGGKGE